MSTLLAAGELLGESYRVVRRIGAGAVGEVYEAEHTRLSRRVAIKLLRAALLDEAHRRRFREEAELASRLQHPNLVEVLDLDLTADGRPYLVMPYLEGEDLAARLSRGRLDVEQALEVASRVGEALVALRRQGLVHRDVKPGNIFLARGSLSDGEEVKLLDLGVAAGVGLAAGRPVGTPRYMAPEQAAGAAVDGRTDLFALGAVLFEALTGRAAFTGESDLQVLRAVAEDAPPRLRSLCPELPEELDQIVRRALAKAPHARYQCAEALVAELAAARGLLRRVTDDRGAPTVSARSGGAGSEPATDPSTDGTTVADPGPRASGRPTEARRRSGLVGALIGAAVAGAAGGALLLSLRACDRVSPAVVQPRLDAAPRGDGGGSGGRRDVAPR